jgi:Mg2+ and Co2+ transporter CorA
MKFESGPKLEGQEQTAEEVELEPELKEEIEAIGDRTVDLVAAEAKQLEERIPKGKKMELRESGKWIKAARAFTLVTVLMGIGGAANKVEAGSWKTRQRQTTGDVLKDIGIQVGGTILREKMERDYEKTRERIRELENELAALEEALDKKQTDLKNVKAQEVTGADVSGLTADIEAEIQRLIGEIDARAKEMDKLRKSSVWKDIAREGARRVTRGRGSWRVNR